MTRRYVTRRAADIDSNIDAESFLSREVHETDPAPRKTGLFDARGNELYSVLDPPKIGFVIHAQREFQVIRYAPIRKEPAAKKPKPAKRKPIKIKRNS